MTGVNDMPLIHELDSDTINKIAAGEVVERPSAVVKELVENALDAKANAITIEIKDGGISFIRITDNGCGIENDDLDLAFKRHSTSKIKSVNDLLSVTSLGFRGEALSSISSVAQVEMITKTADSMLGTRYVCEGGKKISMENIGCPQGTTIIVRNLFYNTPVRRKFLKSPATEAAYISSVVEKLCFANPFVSFKFIVNGQMKLHTSGNNSLKDIIYTVYGRDVTSNLIEINADSHDISVSGYIGKPVCSRGNRAMEIYHINGRYIKSNIISKAIEDAYKGYTMVHRYPFTALDIHTNPENIDVNVHPAKMELRFSNGEQVYNFIYNSVRDCLSGKNLIQNADTVVEKPEKEIEHKPVAEKSIKFPEPFEQKRIDEQRAWINHPNTHIDNQNTARNVPRTETVNNVPQTEIETLVNIVKDPHMPYDVKPKQTSLFDSEEFVKDNKTVNFKIIGQLFLTYWIVECDDKMYIIDQHAAHEKVLFEKTMEKIKNTTCDSQMISPPIVLTLSMLQEEVLKKCMDEFGKLGYEIEHFGDREYIVSAVPANLPGVADEALLIQILDELYEENVQLKSELILDKVASLSCKAAVKGNKKLSYNEASKLIEDLMGLDNPFNCPHGRPTIISMSKYEIEKKFKRIV